MKLRILFFQLFQLLQRAMHICSVWQQYTVTHGRLQHETILTFFHAKALPCVGVFQSCHSTDCTGFSLLHRLIFSSGIDPYLVHFFPRYSGSIWQIQSFLHRKCSTGDFHMRQSHPLRITGDLIDPCSELLRIRRLLCKLHDPIQKSFHPAHT